MSTEEEPRDLTIPFNTLDLRLAEQDSEPTKPEVTAEWLADQAEIERLSELAESIPPRRAR